MSTDRRNSERTLSAGKLPPELLSTLLTGISLPPSVRVGPDVGVDAAVIDVGGRYLVLGMDPVTLSAEPGCFSVVVNANDIAVLGGVPRWLLATILLPIACSAEEPLAAMSQLREACNTLGIALVGGHTEVTDHVDRTLVVACMIGEVEENRLVTPAGAVQGDVVILAG
ncbi:MAG: hypothetical protein DLM70_01610, partial [Chloroflexi bacterium]